MIQKFSGPVINSLGSLMIILSHGGGARQSPVRASDDLSTEWRVLHEDAEAVEREMAGDHNPPGSESSRWIWH